MEAGASDKDKVEAPTGIMEVCSIFYCTDKCEKRKHTIARFVSCVSWIRIELSRCIHIFLQCITSGAKMLRVLFFVEWTSSTNVDSMAFPQTSENTRGRGPKSISK